MLYNFSDLSLILNKILDPTDIYKTLNLKYELNKDEMKVELPGIGKENIKITIEGDILCINVQGKKYNYRLEKYVDKERITSTYKDGILQIKFPEKEKKPKEFLEVKIE